MEQASLRLYNEHIKLGITFYSKSLINFYFIYNIEKQSNTTYNVTYLQFVTDWYKENIYNYNGIETNCLKVKLPEVCVIEEYYCD